MFAHPYVASLIARERERGMLNAAARQRLARQAANRPTTRGAAFRAMAARVHGAWPGAWWRGGGCWQAQNGEGSFDEHGHVLVAETGFGRNAP
jgi:Tfp pilus assembly protein FimT